MKRVSLFLFLTAVVFFMTGCEFISEPSDSNSAIEPTLKSNKVPVPFSAVFSVWLTEAPAPVDGVLEQVEYGISNAPHPTHMGITEFYNEEIIYLSANTGIVPWEEVDPWTAVANVTLTAANGDQMKVIINYTLDPKAFPQLKAEGIGTVNGGTGRFENATGELSFSADFNVADLKGTQYYNGEIRY